MQRVGGTAGADAGPLFSRMAAFSLHPLSAAAALSCFPGSRGARRLQNTGIITANCKEPAGRGSSAAGGTPGRQPRSARRGLRDGCRLRICPAPPREPPAREIPRTRGGAQRRRGSLGTVHARLDGRPCPKALTAFAANADGEAADSSRHLGQARLFCFYPIIIYFFSPHVLCCWPLRRVQHQFPSRDGAEAARIRAILRDRCILRGTTRLRLSPLQRHRLCSAAGPNGLSLPLG